MNQRSGDVAIGILVIGASGLLIWAVSGYRGVAFVAFLVISGGVVIRLFESPSKWSKTFAIFMLPALLLTYLKPKKKPSTEREQN